MYLFDLYSGRKSMDHNTQADWFQEYMQKVFPLLDGQPEVGMATPIWTKGVVG